MMIMLTTHEFFLCVLKEPLFFRFKGFQRKFKSLVDGWKKIYDSNVCASLHNFLKFDIAVLVLK